MDLHFDVAANQITGAQSQQGVAFLTTYLDDKGGDDKTAALVVMADGTVGCGAGPIAASLVVAAFNKAFIRSYGGCTPAGLLRTSLDGANTALSKSVRTTPSLKGIACTLVGAAFAGQTLHWASVGDSHLYLIRDRELRKLNDDHSYGGYLKRLRAEGVDVEPDADISADMLMSAVTGEPIGDVDCREQGLVLRRGDRLIIASPGINTLDDAAMLHAAGRAASAKDCVTALLGDVRSARKADHPSTTVIVVDVLAREGAAAAEAAAGGARAASKSVAPALPTPALSLLDMLSMVAAVLVFIGAAAGSWYGLGLLNEWREVAEPGPAARRTASTLAPALPASQGDAAPGLSFGAPPLPGSGASGSLSFGAPAPLAPAAAPAPALAAAGSASDTSSEGPTRTAAGEVFRDPLTSQGEGPLMVPIPGGTFQMGSGADAAERPVHPVTVASFALGRFEVSVAEFARFASATGRTMPKLEVISAQTSPMTEVSWDAAVAYSRWLSSQTGQRYRLPSEAEWEYAARGGVMTRYWWGRELGAERAHCLDCKSGLDPSRATRVGRFAANSFSLHDTAGNVAEWVHDCWHPGYRGAPDDGSVWEGGDCTLRVTRGGSFASKPDALRVSARGREPSTQGVHTVGFRVARDLQ